MSLIKKLKKITYLEKEDCFFNEENYFKILEITNLNLLSYDAITIQVYLAKFEKVLLSCDLHVQIYRCDELVDYHYFDRKNNDKFNYHYKRKLYQLWDDGKLKDKKTYLIISDKRSEKLKEMIDKLLKIELLKIRALPYLSSINILANYYQQTNKINYQNKPSDLITSIYPSKLNYECKLKSNLQIDEVYVETLYSFHFNYLDPTWLFSKIMCIKNIDVSLKIYPLKDSQALYKQLNKDYQELSKALNKERNPQIIDKLTSQQQLLNQLLTQSNQSDFHGVLFSVLVTFHHSDKQVLNDLVYQFKEYASKLGVIFRTSVYDALMMFQYNAPIGLDLPTSLLKLTSLSTIKMGFPMLDETNIDNKEAFLLGQSEMLNDWYFYDNRYRDKDIYNSNELIIGDSGSGKTSLLLKLIYHRKLLNYNQYIIDLEGKEMPQLVKLLRGINVDFGKMETIINPLEIRNLDDPFPLHQHLQFLKGLLELYHETNLSEASMDVFEEVLLKTYEVYDIDLTTSNQVLLKYQVNDYPILSDVYGLLRQMKKTKEVRECLRYLKPLVKGVDHLLFDGHTNLDLHNSLINFNLASLQNNLENRLLRASYYNVLSYLWHQLMINQQFTQIYCDEFHQLLDYRYLDNLFLVRNLSKRIRKYNGGLTCATQQVSDLLSGEVKEFGETIMENSCQHFYFHLGANSLTYLNQILSLDEDDLLYLKNVGQGSCLFKRGKQTLRLQIWFKDWFIEY